MLPLDSKQFVLFMCLGAVPPAMTEEHSLRSHFRVIRGSMRRDKAETPNVSSTTQSKDEGGFVSDCFDARGHDCV